MILTDREIKNSIAANLISISPPPSDRAYASTSVDLTLGQTIHVFKAPAHGIDAVIDPMMHDYNVIKLLESLTERVEIDAKLGYVAPRKNLVVGLDE